MADRILLIEHIVTTPGVMGGPRIAGHRVSVANVAVLHELHHWDAQKIADELGLTLAQVHAALAYYFDHRDEIDQSIAAGEKSVRAVGVSAEEIKWQIESRRMEDL